MISRRKATQIICFILCLVLVIGVGLSTWKYYMTGRLLKSIEIQDYEEFQSTLPYVFDLEGLPYPPLFCTLSQNYYRTSLQLACEVGNFEMVKLLCEKGADINGVNQYAPFSPLMLAATGLSESNLDIVEYLLQQGADVSYRKDAYNADVLFQIASSRYSIPNIDKIIDQLVKNGGDVYYFHKSYGTLLNISAYWGTDDVLVYLLQNYEIDPNLGIKGQTALMNYCRNQTVDVEIVELFLDCGADKTLIDIDGKTAYDYAIENGHMEVASLLKLNS